MTNEEEFMMMAVDPLVGRMEQVRKLVETLADLINKGAEPAVTEPLDTAIDVLLESVVPKKTANEFTFTPDPDGNVTPIN